VQELFDAGEISAVEAIHHPSANIITHAIGADVLELGKVTDRVLPGDRFLLCSDGLLRTLPEPELARILAAEDDLRAERLLVPPSNTSPRTISLPWRSRRPRRRIGETSPAGR
jgi:serine/threonine-protein phosphatase Stp1